MKRVFVVLLCCYAGVIVSAFDISRIKRDIANMEHDLAHYSAKEAPSRSEVFLGEDGDAGASCKKGIKGTCMKPSECGGRIEKGACNGGADNVCCVTDSASSSASASDSWSASSSSSEASSPSSAEASSSSSASASSDAPSVTADSTPAPPSDSASASASGGGGGGDGNGGDVLPKDGWTPDAFNPDPNFAAPEPCPQKASMPDIAKLASDDSAFTTQLDKIAATRADWSKGKEDKEKAKAALNKDWMEYAKYIINRMAMPQKNKKGECTVATYMNKFVPKVKFGFLCAMYNKARFDLLPQNSSPTSISKPAGEPETVTNTAIVGGSDQQKVAQCVMDNVKILNSRTHVGSGTYIGHSWGPYSIDFFPLGGSDPCKFYNKDKAVEFLDALEKLSKERGFKWRCLYDDFDVAKRFNEKYKVKKVHYVKYHGPDPFVLHLHCDFNC